MNNQPVQDSNQCAAMSVKSDGRLRQLDTPYGRLAAAICYDTDFPRFMAQAGAHRPDVVLSPAGDWRAIDPRHTEIASYRAIEQGFNLFRQSNGGLSAPYDYQGRRLASMDEYQSADLTLLAQIPTRGTATIYSRLGDWFAWLCVLAVLTLTAFAWARRGGKYRPDMKQEFFLAGTCRTSARSFRVAVSRPVQC
jgi:apolipoprotein N-acyltransferase